MSEADGIKLAMQQSLNQMKESKKYKSQNISNASKVS